MKIIAYHSNLYMDAFEQHVTEIKAKGFDTILFCISETDMLYNLEIFQEFRLYAESEGLHCWGTFWGLFAGEAVITNKVNMRCWNEKVISIGFKDIFIDEPKQVYALGVQTIVRTYAEVNLHLCLTDDTFNKMTDDDIMNIPVKSLGVSCYHWTKDWMKIVTRSEAIARRLHQLRPDDNFIFVQGFDLSEGWEDIPMIVKDICQNEGITNFGFWSFRGTITGTKRSANPKVIWDKISF